MEEKTGTQSRTKKEEIRINDDEKNNEGGEGNEGKGKERTRQGSKTITTIINFFSLGKV